MLLVNRVQAAKKAEELALAIQKRAAREKAAADAKAAMAAK